LPAQLRHEPQQQRVTDQGYGEREQQVALFVIHRSHVGKEESSCKSWNDGLVRLIRQNIIRTLPGTAITE
jgi:hypothetical protein